MGKKRAGSNQLSIFQEKPAVVKRKKRSTEISVFDHGVPRAAPAPWMVPPAGMVPHMPAAAAAAPSAAPAASQLGLAGVPMRRTRSKGHPMNFSFNGIAAIGDLLERSDKSFNGALDEALAPFFDGLPLRKTRSSRASGLLPPPPAPPPAPPAPPLGSDVPLHPSLSDVLGPGASTGLALSGMQQGVPMRKTRSSSGLAALPMQPSLSDVFGAGASSGTADGDGGAAGSSLALGPDALSGLPPVPGVPMRKTRSSKMLPPPVPLQPSISEMVASFIADVPAGEEDVSAMIGA